MMKDLIRKTAALEVGEELYRNYLSSFPTAEQIGEIVNALDPYKDFEVHETINGYLIKRVK